MLLWKKTLCLIWLAAFCTVSAPIATAQVYRWVDEDGVTHFSDQAPKGQKADKLKLRTESPSASSSPSARHEYDPQRLKENEQRFLRAVEAERRAKEERKAEMARQKAEKEKYCLGLRNDLMDFRDGRVMVRRNEKGEMEYVPDEEVNARREQLEKLWLERCVEKP